MFRLLFKLRNEDLTQTLNTIFFKVLYFFKKIIDMMIFSIMYSSKFSEKKYFLMMA